MKAQDIVKIMDATLSQDEYIAGITTSNFPTESMRKFVEQIIKEAKGDENTKI